MAAPCTNQNAQVGGTCNGRGLKSSAVASQRIHNGCSKEGKANNFQARRV